MTPIYATADQGRVHIACGAFYQGSVSSYGNWFTKFVTKLFCVSMDVSINDKTYVLNKNSYVKLLQSLNTPNATLKTIRTFQNFNTQTVTPRGDLGLMRTRLTFEKVHARGRKMIDELVKGNYVQVEKLLGKGAEINSCFWMKGTDGKVYFDRDPKESGAYPLGKVEPVAEYKYTPFHYATNKGMENTDFRLRDLFIQFGADQTSQGITRFFQRDVLQVTPGVEEVSVQRRDVTYVPTVRTYVVPNRGHYYGHHSGPHRPGCHIQTALSVEPVVSSRLGLDRVMTETTTFRDVYSNEKTIMYNSVTGFLDPSLPKAPLEQIWTNKRETSRQYIV